MKRSAAASEKMIWRYQALSWLRLEGRLRAGTAHRLHLIRPYGMVANLITNFEHVPVERLS